MPDETVARRYAAALFQQSESAGTLDTVYTDLQGIRDVMKGSPQLAAVLGQPLITEQKKKDTLTAIFGTSVSTSTLGFLNLLVDKRRINMLDGVIDEFITQVRASRNIEAATAITAIPMTFAQKDALIASLESRTGKKIELSSEVDPAVLGGVRVRIGDTVLDGTVKGNLDRLRERLIARS